jgi:CelD/BcsL family acetyltransferase involved in cellulose biosynthesis
MKPQTTPHPTFSRPYPARTSRSPGSFSATLAPATIHNLEELAPEWEVLANDHPNNEPFYQPYWFTAFARHFRTNSQQLHLLTVRKDALLRGVLPCVRTSNFLGRIPAKTLRVLSGIHSCRTDFVCSTSEREEVALCAWKSLRYSTDWHVIEALNIPTGGAFELLLECAARDGYRVAYWPTLISPYLTLPAPESDPFANCPQRYKSTRKGLDRYLRRLKQFGEPRLKVHAEYSDELFDEFVALEGSGWKGRQGSAIRCTASTLGFYREIMQQASNLGQLMLSSLSVNDTPVAMELAFVVGNQYFSPKIAYDEKYARCSPGQLLAKYCIEELVRRGISTYDMLGPQARYKAIWTNEVRPHQNCYIFRPSLDGRLYHAFTTQVAARAKRLKYKLYGDPQSLEKPEKH